MRLSQLESLVALTGLPCAGKTTGAGIISKQFGHAHFEASDAMRDIHVREGQPWERIDEFALRSLALDPAKVVLAILAAVTALGHRRVVVSGLRSPSELAVLTHIFVEASMELRHQRAIARGRADRIESLSAFAVRDELQRKMGVGLIGVAPTVVRVRNEGSLELFGATLLRVAGAHLTS